MERKVLIKIFNRFLKEKGLYSKFYHNSFAESRDYYWPPSLIGKNGDTEILEFDLVNDGFCWEDTCEGHDFWCNICKEWLELFSQKIEHNFI